MVLHVVTLAALARHMERNVTIEQLSGSAVFSLYTSKRGNGRLLKMLGKISNPRVPLLIFTELSAYEQWQFSKVAFEQMTEQFLPLIVEAACKVMKEHPEVVGEEFQKMVELGVRDWVERTSREVGKLEQEKIKTARDAKPRNTERDDEIVRLRDDEDKTFGEIPRLLLQKNPSWSRKDGKPLKRDTVEKAYLRRKELGTN